MSQTKIIVFYSYRSRISSSLVFQWPRQIWWILKEASGNATSENAAKVIWNSKDDASRGCVVFQTVSATQMWAKTGRVISHIFTNIPVDLGKDRMLPVLVCTMWHGDNDVKLSSVCKPSGVYTHENLVLHGISESSRLRKPKAQGINKIVSCM